MKTSTPGTVDIKCTEQIFPEFPQLLFGETIDSSVQYFDATDFLTKMGLTEYTPDLFFSNYAHLIGSLITAYNLDKDQVKLRNTEGHTLINSTFVYAFLAWTDPNFTAYLNERIDDMFKAGFTASDTYIVNNMVQRFDRQVLDRVFDEHTSS
jgi:hypothetical protein